jgi:DNA polymerase-3 subunit delta'
VVLLWNLSKNTINPTNDFFFYFKIMQNLSWHKNIIEQIRLMQDQERLPHGLLLRGPEGIGKQNLSMNIAREVLCLPRSEADSNLTKARELFDSRSHPDLYVITRLEEKKDISIDQVREVRERLSTTSHQGGWKVCVIYPAERMNKNSMNALLKILEEPTPKTMFILVSHIPKMLLATIMSRCHIMNVPVPDYNSSMKWLLKGSNYDENEVKSALVLSNNRPFLAAEFLENNLLSEHERFKSILIGVAKLEINFVSAADEIKKLNPIYCLDWFVKYIHSLLIENSNNNKLEIHECLDHIISAKNMVIRGHPINIQLAWEDLMMKWLKSKPTIR